MTNNKTAPMNGAVGSLLKADRTADRPQGPGAALDPDRDQLAIAVVAEAVHLPLREPRGRAAVSHRGSFLVGTPSKAGPAAARKRRVRIRRSRPG